MNRKFYRTPNKNCRDWIISCQNVSESPIKYLIQITCNNNIKSPIFWNQYTNLESKIYFLVIWYFKTNSRRQVINKIIKITQCKPIRNSKVNKKGKPNPSFNKQ